MAHVSIGIYNILRYLIRKVVGNMDGGIGGIIQDNVRLGVSTGRGGGGLFKIWKKGFMRS